MPDGTQQATGDAPLSFADEIRANKRKTVLIVAFMFAILWGVVFIAGWAFGYPPIFTGILAVVIGGGYIWYTYSRSVETVIRAADARPANRAVREEKLLIHRVEEMTIAAGLPKPPEVYIQESKDPNAFAAGKDFDEAIICVTTGGLEMWDQEELEGVIAHETAHILNRDILLQTVTVGVVGAIAMLSEILLRSLWFSGGGGRKGKGGAILIVVGVLALILAPIVSRLTYLAMSRNREYLADATAVRLTRNNEGLAQALEKLRDDMPDDPKGSKTVASLYLGNPFKRNVDSANLFSTHPPLNERVRRIRAMT